MGVYIKSMKLPASCEVCPLNYDSIDCMVADNALRENGGGDFLFHHERHPNGPLIPVSEHGRLIDADALARDLFDDVEYDQRALDKMDFVGKERERVEFDKDCKQNCMRYLSNAPTIIQADNPNEEME